MNSQMRIHSKKQEHSWVWNGLWIRASGSSAIGHEVFDRFTILPMASEYVVQVENIVNGLCAFYTVVFTDDPRGDVRGFRGSFQCRDFCSVEYLFNRFGRLLGQNQIRRNVACRGEWFGMGARVSGKSPSPENFVPETLLRISNSFQNRG